MLKSILAKDLLNDPGVEDLQILTNFRSSNFDKKTSLMTCIIAKWITIKFVVEDSKFIDPGPNLGRRVHKDAYLIHIFFFGL